MNNNLVKHRNFRTFYKWNLNIVENFLLLKETINECNYFIALCGVVAISYNIILTPIVWTFSLLETIIANLYRLSPIKFNLPKVPAGFKKNLKKIFLGVEE